MATAKYTGKDTRVTVIINDVSPLGFFAWRCAWSSSGLVWCVTCGLSLDFSHLDFPAIL